MPDRTPADVRADLFRASTRVAQLRRARDFLTPDSPAAREHASVSIRAAELRQELADLTAPEVPYRY